MVEEEVVAVVGEVVVAAVMVAEAAVADLVHLNQTH
jgi:hypothetical protein